MQYPFWRIKNNGQDTFQNAWSQSFFQRNWMELKDYGPAPLIINIEDATIQNDTFRTVLWTGEHLQLTLMSIPIGGDIGIEIHENVDQFLRLEQGHGLVKLGYKKDELTYEQAVTEDFAIIIPAGTWHNIVNVGQVPLKIYSIYAPPQHKYGTVHLTKADAELDEHH